jgi:hypothetical protein
MAMGSVIWQVPGKDKALVLLTRMATVSVTTSEPADRLAAVAE